MSILVYSIAVPFLAGLLCLLVPKRFPVLNSIVALAAVAASAVINIKIFLMEVKLVRYTILGAGGFKKEVGDREKAYSRLKLGILGVRPWARENGVME